MATYYYMRVSTKQQSLTRQEDAAKAADIPKQNWYCDKSTGRKISRDSLNALLDKAQEGDTIIVHSFDRLSRSTKDLLNTIDTLNERGIKLVSEKENLDTSTPTGKLMVAVIAAINEFEIEIAKERQAEGIAAKKARGEHWGGRKPISKVKLDAAVDLYLEGEKPATVICKELGFSRAKLYNELAKRGIKRD